jgi:hypothetical protein
MSLLFLRVKSRFDELCSSLLSLRASISFSRDEKFYSHLPYVGTCSAAETYLCDYTYENISLADWSSFF